MIRLKVQTFSELTMSATDEALVQSNISSVSKKNFLEAKICSEINTLFAPSIEVSPLVSGKSDKLSRHGYLQDDDDVHGSHELFYWTRSRGSGSLVSSEDAAVLLYYSEPFDRIILVRPVGNLAGIIKILDAVSSVIHAVTPGESVVVRYCNSKISNELRKLGWSELSRPLLQSAYVDDETWPEVILCDPAYESPQGAEHRVIRKAILRYQEKYHYKAEKNLIGLGELEFMLDGSSRADVCDSYENSFNYSLVEFLKLNKDCDLTYHYLISENCLVGFGVTGRNTSSSHCYYSGVHKEPRLSTYFLWRMYVTERNSGADSLNFGGSEQRSLYEYKSKTFRKNLLRFTYALER
jgi:hypothetical protein